MNSEETAILTEFRASGPLAYDINFVKQLLNYPEYLIVGRSVLRVDGLYKALGLAKYTEDYITDKALRVKVLRSPYPHASVKALSKSCPIEGVWVFTADDIPGENNVSYDPLGRQELLVKDRARFVGDQVALIAAEREDAASRCIGELEVRYEPLPFILSIEDALRSNAVKIHEGGNIAGRVNVMKGDVDWALEHADVVVEGVYHTGYQDHAYIEPEAAIAIPEGPDRISIIATTQNPFRTRNTVAKVLGLNYANVRVIVPYIGGGFGGKDAMGPIVAANVGLVAMRTGKPAAQVFTREESIAYHYKRTPFKIIYRSGATKDGKLVAADVEIFADVGAYIVQGFAVLRRAAFHATGPYNVPNVRVSGVAVYTNNIPTGAFEGFGNPQVQFAAELQMDKLAEKLSMDPLEFRINNSLIPGSTTLAGQLLDHSVGIRDLLVGVARRSGWGARRSAVHSSAKGAKKVGIGIACGWHGIGTTGSPADYSSASIIINADGSVTYRTGIVELGQGAFTAHAMVVAEALGVPLDSINVETIDTSTTLDGGETHASRGLAIGGSAALDAALRLRERLVKVASEVLGVKESEIVIMDGRVYVRRDGGLSEAMGFGDLVKEAYLRGVSLAESGFVKPNVKPPDPQTGQGAPYFSYTFSCAVAEVEVDMETGKVRVLRLCPGVAAGKIVNPELARGQVYGGSVIGMGWTLLENLIIEGGKILNDTFTDYNIPTIKDVPDFCDPVFVEDEYMYSAFGAKGIGEAAIIAVPPAIVNAIHDATGVWFDEIPLTLDKVFFRLRR
jgi:CO/xanthine dehydrogenase Mo-binding subunit